MATVMIVDSQEVDSVNTVDIEHVLKYPVR